MKTQKRQRTGSEWGLVGTVLLALSGIVFVLSDVHTAPEETAWPRTDVESAAPEKPHVVPGAAAHIQEMSLWYRARHGALGSFWLTGDEWFTNAEGIVIKWADRVRRLLQRYQGVNALSAVIAGQFGTFTISVFGTETSRWIVHGVRLREGEVVPESTVEVCVVPERRLSTWHDRSYVGYNAQNRAVFIAALKMPDAFLAAIMFHELGHAYLHQIMHLPEAPYGTDENYREEVAMNEFMHEVFDYASNGGLKALYARIVSRGGRTGDEILSAVTDADLMEYDRLLGLGGVSYELSQGTVPQFWIGLGLYAVNALNPTLSAEARLTAKVAFLSWHEQVKY